jgi:hypothetical protein
MKKATGKRRDELRREYDFSKLAGGVRGKYYKRYSAGTNLVLLQPDVAQAFPDGESVNEALRILMKAAARGKTRKRVKRT